MPAPKFFSLAVLATGLAGSVGCTSTGSGFDDGLQATSGYSYAGESGLTLPDAVELIPSSFAGSADGGAYKVASLVAVDGGEGPAGGEAPAQAVAEAPPPPGQQLAAAEEAPALSALVAAPKPAAAPSPEGKVELAALRPDAPAGKQDRAAKSKLAMLFPPAPDLPLIEPEPGKTRPLRESGRPEIDRLIEKYAEIYEVPTSLVRRMVRRESNFNPRAFNNGHWGLGQIKHATARGMGYQGTAEGLFDAETNLKYSVKYLRGAWLVSQGNADQADRLYQTGYYYHAKRMGLLEETGLGKDRVRRRGSGA